MAVVMKPAATMQASITSLLQNSSDMNVELLKNIVNSLRIRSGYITDTGSAVATVLADTSTPVVIVPVTTLTGAYEFDSPLDTGDLRYTGVAPARALVTCSMSYIKATAADDINFRFAKTGTNDDTTLQTQSGLLAADQDAITLTWLVDVVENDIFTVLAVNETSSDNITVEEFQLSAIAWVV